MSISKSELRKLRKKLPANYAQQIKDSTGLSLSLIYKVIAGQRYNQAIIEAAYQVANELKMSIESTREKIANL